MSLSYTKGGIRTQRPVDRSTRALRERVLARSDITSRLLRLMSPMVENALVSYPGPSLRAQGLSATAINEWDF
jgi:hypothetical protein